MGLIYPSIYPSGNIAIHIINIHKSDVWSGKTRSCKGLCFGFKKHNITPMEMIFLSGLRVVLKTSDVRLLTLKNCYNKCRYNFSINETTE